jgi:hypothetical protein
MLYSCTRESRVLILSVSMVLGLRLIIEVPYFSDSVVVHEGDFIVSLIPL